MSLWPAWDWSPSGHRGVTLALHHCGVAVRKKAYRPLTGQGPGVSWPTLRSDTYGLCAGNSHFLSRSVEPRAGTVGGEDLVRGREPRLFLFFLFLSFFPFFLVLTHPGSSPLRYGDWRADSYLGAREFLLRWELSRRSGLETS